jgi:hypothetical protein
MLSYAAWVLAALLVLVGFLMLIVVPGVGVLALVALAIGIVVAAVLAINYGGRGEPTSDVEERRAEHLERQDERRRAR